MSSRHATQLLMWVRNSSYRGGRPARLGSRARSRRPSARRLSSHPGSACALPSSRSRSMFVIARLPRPCVRIPQRAPELRARVVQRLVDRAARRSEAFREHVGGDFVHGHALKDEPLSLGESLVDRAPKRREQLLVARWPGAPAAPASGSRSQIDSSTSTLRFRQARRRRRDDVSRIANLQAHVVNRAAPRYDSSFARIAMRASLAASTQR